MKRRGFLGMLAGVAAASLPILRLPPVVDELPEGAKIPIRDIEPGELPGLPFVPEPVPPKTPSRVVIAPDEADPNRPSGCRIRGTLDGFQRVETWYYTAKGEYVVQEWVRLSKDSYDYVPAGGPHDPTLAAQLHLPAKGE